MGNILVLGNGFDLYHGLKTKYYDFVQFVKNPPSDTRQKIKQSCKQNTFLQYFIKVCEINDNWIDCEEEIGRVVLLVQKIINNSYITEDRAARLKKDVTISNIEFVIMQQLKKYGTELGDQTFIFKEEYVINKVLNKKKVLQEFREELNEVIDVLSYYLEKELSKREIDSKCPQIADKEFQLVVNFNYTDTYEKVYSKNPIIFYQHGKLKWTRSVILGIPDDDEISLDFVYFKKYFQRIQKRSGILEKELFRYEKQNDLNTTTYFFGMSMGKTDEDLIKQIMGKSDKIIIFYYDQDDYEGKVINLIGVFVREKIEKWINSDKIKFEELKWSVDKKSTLDNGKISSNE